MVMLLPNSGYDETASTDHPSFFGFSLNPAKVAVTLWVLHVSLFFLSLAAGGRPQDLIYNVVRNINACIINPIFSASTVVAFLLQARINGRFTAEQPHALNKWTLGLQSIVYLLLAISWPFRLKVSPNMRQAGPKPFLLMTWYPWVGWACINNAVLAIGQGLMLLSLSRVGPGQIRLTDESRP